MKEIIIKNASKDINKELESINFDKAYIDTARKKYSGNAYKIFNLKPYEANILKQICLSLGFDCAVSRDSVTCNCEYTDCILFTTPDKAEKLSAKLKEQPFRLKKTAEKLDYVTSRSIEPLVVRGFSIEHSGKYIAGILNVTPDSFSDGGKYNNVETALKHTREMINDGADIIDIGGESSRPGAEIISVTEEISRVVPVIEALRKEYEDIPISIDTRNYETAKAAIEAGADIINDVSGLKDERLTEFVIKNNLPVIIMHSDKVPAVSSDFTSSDVTEQIYFSFYKKIKTLTESGLERKNIIIDPGIGFGKSKESNFEILKRMREFTSLNVLIMSGISRKSFIRNEFQIDLEESDVPTALYGAMLESVNIHRVHNVKMTKKFLDYARLIRV